MKKIITLILAMAMVLGCVSVFADGAADVSVSEGMRLSYDGIYYDKFLDSEAEISVTLENKGAEDVSVTFVVAEYSVSDGCKTMVGFKRVADSIKAAEKKPFKLTYDVENIENTISVFAFGTTSLGVVSLGSFELDAYQYVGSEEEGTSVYKINKFEE